MLAAWKKGVYPMIRGLDLEREESASRLRASRALNSGFVGEMETF